MSINNTPTIEPRQVTGIFTDYIAKTLPLAFDDSMSYYECLCALLKYINDTIVPDINNTNSGLSELQTFYEELQIYVNNYFDSIDLQEEVNKKLDEMVEDGTISEIINNIIFYEVNVKLAGAKGDGTTDDTDVIQALINEEKPLYFPAGTYKISGLTCNGKCNIRGDGRNQTVISSLDGEVSCLIDAENNTGGLSIKDLTINGNNVAEIGIKASKRTTGYTSTRRNIIDNVGIINCTEKGLYVGGVSATVNNINIVNCNKGIDVESYGVIIDNSCVSQCIDYGIKLSNGNGYVSNNKIYLNKDGIICNGLSYCISNNTIEQNTDNGIIFTDISNSNDAEGNILLANGYYTDVQPTNNYEIKLDGYNNKVSGIVIPYIEQWNSKRKAIVQNIYGFNNSIEITLSNSLQVNNGLNLIGEITSYELIDGYNIGNNIMINNSIDDISSSGTITTTTATGDHTTTDLTNNVQTLTISNITLNKWGGSSITGLEGGMSRVVPSKTTGLLGLYVTFDVKTSIQYDKLGVGHYLSYYTNSLVPVNSVTNVRNTFNPLTNKHKILLYVLFDEPTDITYFQVNTRFLSYNNSATTINEIEAEISNIKYYAI